jgi:sigma-54 specific flagellar transcriptional regulator A
MKTFSATPIIGQSEPTRGIKALIKTLAPSDSTVLITGESGTGKELIAQALHAQGPRHKGPFVPINCGAIPRDLIESELFGHRKGAFTGAFADRLGRFELAQGGTIFLDEVGDLPLDMQVKLLRVLQERTVLPVGAVRDVEVDVRVVAATHKNLEKEVADGRFREDLYYRLNVLPCQTTPLHERTLDIPDLLAFYAAHYARDTAPPIRFATDLTDALMRYRWPGNVRELANLVDRFTTLYVGQELHLHDISPNMLPAGLAEIQRDAAEHRRNTSACPMEVLSMVMGRDSNEKTLMEPSNSKLTQVQHAETLTESANWAAPQDLSLTKNTTEFQKSGYPHEVEEIICMAQGMVQLPPEGLALKDQLVQIERNLIEQALARTSGNVSQSARLLRLQRTTLIEKINKYELRGFVEQFESETR